MKKLLATFALTAIGSMSAFAATWTGYIADSKCKHVDGTEAHIACTENASRAAPTPCSSPPITRC